MKQRILNALAAMKRRILNALSLIVIVAVGVLASRFYDKPLTIAPDSDTPAPDVNYLGIVEILFEPEGVPERSLPGRIAIALEIPERTPPPGGFLADLLEVYRWSRQYYLPIKCGDDYPPNLCQYGQTEIYLVGRSKMQVIGGMADVYALRYVMILDQQQIDNLFAGGVAELMEGPQDLVDFHLQVAQTTQGTGGGFAAIEGLQIFPGIPPR